jgi:hypothetical protein
VNRGRLGDVVVCPFDEGTIVGIDTVEIVAPAGNVVDTIAGSADGDAVGTRSAGPGSVLKVGPLL